MEDTAAVAEVLEVDLEEDTAVDTEETVDMAAVSEVVTEADMEVVVVVAMEILEVDLEEDTTWAAEIILAPAITATVYRLVLVAGKC